MLGLQPECIFGTQQTSARPSCHNGLLLALLQPQRIVLPEALDPRVLKAAAELLRRGQANIILLGQQDAVQVRRFGQQRVASRFTRRKVTMRLGVCPTG